MMWFPRRRPSTRGAVKSSAQGFQKCDVLCEIYVSNQDLALEMIEENEEGPGGGEQCAKMNCGWFFFFLISLWLRRKCNFTFRARPIVA